jgi:hypothetical protein
MSEPDTLVFILESADFFSVGRVLQRAIGKSMLDDVTLEVENQVLTVTSRWGGSQMPCTGMGEITATLKAKAFCTLVTTRFREKAPTGPMKLTFRPALKEVAVDGAGVKAKF